MGFMKLSSEFSKNFIIDESNQCVSCGLCLPHCPTYRLLKSEADSPRGRIALMSGMANGRIPLNARFMQHMDRCLTCRACEAVCPNHVSFGHLMDETRALINEQSGLTTINRKSWVRMLMEKILLTRPERLDLLRQLFYLIQKGGSLSWLMKFRLFGESRILKLISQLPFVKFPYSAIKNKKYAASSHWQEIYPAEGKKRGEVSLFLGCVARITDVATLNSSIYVLNRLGYTVHVPRNQACCGAIHQHSGALKQAAELAQQNKSVFGELTANIVINTASGCGVQLLESGVGMHHKLSLESNNVENVQVLSSITDISQFLVAAEGWENVKILPLPQRVLVHDPCTLRNVLRDQTYPYELISRIPEVQVVPLTGNDQCCGAAGTYFIDQPDIADRLLDDKVSAIIDGEAKYLVTSNIGCSMHITYGLSEKKINIEVLHPVTLLARQMGLEL